MNYDTLPSHVQGMCNQGHSDWSCHYCGNAAWHADNDIRLCETPDGVYVTVNRVHGSVSEYVVRGPKGRKLAMYNASRDGFVAACAAAGITRTAATTLWCQGVAQKG